MLKVAEKGLLWQQNSQIASGCSDALNHQSNNKIHKRHPTIVPLHLYPQILNPILQEPFSLERYSIVQVLASDI